MNRLLFPVYVTLWLSLACCTVTAQTPFWEPSNGPYEGSVQAMAFASNGMMFIGTPNGCFRSSDQGISWTIANPSLRRVNVMSLLVTSNGTLIAGSRDSTIFRSTNWGDDWTSITLSGRILSDLAEYSGNVFLAAKQGGVFRSSDDGITWRITDTTALKAATEIEVSNNYLVVGNYQGIFRSSDLGVNWVKSNSGIGGIVFALSSSTGSDLFASAYGAASPHRLFRSTDTGNTWNPIDTTVLAFNHIMAMYAAPSGELFAYSGLQERTLYKFTNRGTEWDTVSWPSTNRWLSIQKIGGGNNDQLLLGTDHSIFLSNNGGIQWTEASSGVSAAQILNVISTPHNNLFGVSLSGLYRSTDQGKSWSKKSDFAPRLIIALDDSNGGEIVIGRTGTGVHRSSDNGEAWQTEEVFSGHDDIVGLAKGPNQEAYYSEDVGSYVYASVDLGKSWIRGKTTPKMGQLRWLTVDKKGRVIAVSSITDKVFISSDSGNTWKEVPHTLSALRKVFASPFTESFVGISHTSVYEFREVNGQWEISDLGLVKQGLTSVVFSSNGEIFVSAIINNNIPGGVYVRRSNGSWDSLLTGLPVPSVNTLSMGRDGRLYAATAGGSIIRSAMPVSNVVDDPIIEERSAAVVQISPNPALTHSTVRLWIPRTQQLTVRLYSALGQKINTLFEGSLAQGSHNLMLDTEPLTSGLYLLKIEQDGYTQTFSVVVGR